MAMLLFHNVLLAAVCPSCQILLSLPRENSSKCPSLLDATTGDVLLRGAARIDTRWLAAFACPTSFGCRPLKSVEVNQPVVSIKCTFVSPEALTACTAARVGPALLPLNGLIAKITAFG